MALGMVEALRDSRLQQIINKIDNGGVAGKIEFYTGPQPATGAAITAETLLGTCDLSFPCATIATGVLTFNSISDDILADATGDIVWARVLDSNDVIVMDGDCGITASGKTFIFNSLAVQTGGTIRVLSGSLTEGNL